MSRYCLDCVGDCCCPSLEAEIERLHEDIARAAVTRDAAQGALAECMAEMTQAGDILAPGENIPLLDKAERIRLACDLDREIGRERNEMKAEIATLRADLARVTAERDQSATMAHVWETRYKVTFEAATHVAIERDALAKQRDELVAKLVELFDWSDTSYVHASLHVGNAVKNLRADMAALKAKSGKKANDATWVTTWKRVAKEAESQANAFGAELTALECDMAQLRTDLARVTAERDALAKRWEYLWRAGCPACGAEPGCNIDCRVCAVYARLEKLEAGI